MKFTLNGKSQNIGLARHLSEVEPSEEELQKAWLVFLQIRAKLGDAARIVEVVRISFFQPHMSLSFKLFVDAVLNLPGSEKKREISNHEYGEYGNSTEDDVEWIANSFIEKVRGAFKSEGESAAHNVYQLGKLMSIVNSSRSDLPLIPGG